MTARPLPYDLPGYAEGYDAKYLGSEINAAHARFEVGMVAGLARARPGLRWLDACCGTGMHLRETPGEMRREGVDRSAGMLRVARSRRGHPARFHCRDARFMDDLGTFDLVTSFFYGYVHETSVDRALSLLRAMADAVSPSGDFLLGICDPVGAFEDGLPRRTPTVYRSDVCVDAVIWSYDEPVDGHGSGASFDLCVAPHPELIVEILAPRFRAHGWRDYPTSAAAPGWRRRALHFRGRLEDAP